VNRAAVNRAVCVIVCLFLLTALAVRQEQHLRSGGAEVQRVYLHGVLRR
jgi:hypothetical protein